jgi:hypothetical protein
MSEVVKIAEAVVAELAEYNAELVFFPEFELRELETMRVAVVPTGTEYKILSRNSHEEVLKVSVGFLKRGCGDELPELLKLVEGIGLGFLGKKCANAPCVTVAFNPIYSPDHLRERGQFTSVIELAFKQIR